MSSQRKQDSGAGRRRRRRTEVSSAGPDCCGGPVRPRSRRAGARQGHGEGVRQPGSGRADDAEPRRGGDDRRAHRADRPADFAAAERGAAPPVVPEAGGDVARHQVSAGPERDQRHAEDQAAERVEEGPAEGPAARAGVRPERVVQEGLRRGVRRRSAARRFAALVGDYEFGRGPEDMELLEKVSQVAVGGACAVPVGGVAGDDEPGELYADLAGIARHGEDVRQHGVCEVEVASGSRTIRATWR